MDEGDTELGGTSDPPETEASSRTRSAMIVVTAAHSDLAEGVREELFFLVCYKPGF